MANHKTDDYAALKAAMPSLKGWVKSAQAIIALSEHVQDSDALISQHQQYQKEIDVVIAETAKAQTLLADIKRETETEKKRAQSAIAKLNTQESELTASNAARARDLDEKFHAKRVDYANQLCTADAKHTSSMRDIEKQFTVDKERFASQHAALESQITDTEKQYAAVIEKLKKVTSSVAGLAQ